MAAPLGNKYAVGKRKFPDPDVFDSLIESYFDKCENDNTVPTVEGLAVHIGCNRSTIAEYGHLQWDETPEDADIKDKYSITIKKARERCKQAMVNAGMSARNPAMHIFLLKNNYNYRDKTEQELTVIGLGDALKALDY